ncbi:MAG: BREX system P-loop protein BrxC [Oscillospiraceae bacterium]|nr:BREX system P-loop protein BrxC [Oscillospiraceae bacterium]
MIIQEMFVKRIDRDIKGVIKVGQGEDSNVQQELEEYVVTRELQKHFAEFFSAYKKGILGNTDKMGVWISGFFGSGKSHFLKILSYLLENKEVGNRRAIDYFVEDGKITDGMVLADMKLAAETSTNVILFNIDSKGAASGKQDKDAIISVFLKVFNEMQGFYGANPHIADLERRLSYDGKYVEFKEKFEERNGDSWVEARNEFDYSQDDVVDVLVDMDIMSEEAARNWCEKAFTPYNISIEEFAKLVKKYIDRKGKNHHVVFLVDEIGQYIGDNSRLMLNLQTVTEDLGTECRGKAWIIVTSQQDIDSVIKVKGNDFSKIMGRFDTRLSLSSANVDEVIRERILKKDPVAAQTLSVLYDDKATILKNLILFNDGIEKKLYSGRENFAAVYPFVPYQFDLLGAVLTAIRTHGAAGKHLADGERSMLALFKESAMQIMDRETGALVPFYMFYDALEEFVEHSHKGVISKALENEYINPDHEEDCFRVNVLKALFMIKYVKEIKSNINNIASLMVSDISDDRLGLVKKVEDALKVLEKQTLIQKNNDEYVFLTNEEQDINRAISHQGVDSSEVTNKVAELIFDGLFDEKKYRYPAFNNRYAFPFNQVVDDRPYKGSSGYDLTLKVLTPDSDEISDEETMRFISSQSSCVLVVLPDDRTFLDEIIASAKIEKFLRFDATNAVARYEEIKNAKRTEMHEHNQNARTFLTDALKAADIYVSGDKLQTSAKDITGRIREALAKLVATVYHKLSYIDIAMSESDIRTLIKGIGGQGKLGLGAEKKNELALNDVRDYIAQNTGKHTKTSMKTLMDRFMKAPYGFVEDDVKWLVARLFKDGDITLFVNSEAVTSFSKSDDDIIRYITKKEFVEKLMTEKKEKPGEHQIKAVREVMKELFHVSSSAEDEETLMKSFHGYAQNLKTELEKLEIRYQSQPAYPGKQLVNDGKKLMIAVLNMKYSDEFFKTVYAERDNYLDFAEDFEPLKSFFEGEQKSIFDKSLNLMAIYNDSKTFIVSKEIEIVVKDIRTILKMSAPYSSIYKLPELNSRFTTLYMALLEDMAKPIYDAIDDARTRVLNELSGKQCEVSLRDRYIERFARLREKADSCNNVATLQNIKVEADALKVRLLNEIAEEEARTVIEYPPVDGGGDTEVIEPVKPLKKKKTVSIKSVNSSTTWQIESEHDIDQYLAALRKKLIGTLEENTIVNIEF